MNSIIMNAQMISVKPTHTKIGVPKTFLLVETDGRGLPLRFFVVAFGETAEAAAKLLVGDEVLANGRFTSDASSKTVSIVANAVELS